MTVILKELMEDLLRICLQQSVSLKFEILRQQNMYTTFDTFHTLLIKFIKIKSYFKFFLLKSIIIDDYDNTILFNLYNSNNIH